MSSLSERATHTPDGFLPSSIRREGNFFFPFFLRGAILSGTMHIYAPARRREERKTNGTDWFPAVATLTRWQLRKRAPGLPSKTGNTRTPVNNPIKMDRKRTPGTLSATTATIVVIIALPLSLLRLLHCRRNCATVSEWCNSWSSQRVQTAALYQYLVHAVWCPAIRNWYRATFNKVKF